MVADNLKDALDSQYCIIKCGAMWCSSCKQQEQIIKENHLDNLMEENDVNYFPLDVDDEENDNFIDSYDIKSLPTMLLFKNGENVSLLKGLQPPTKLKEEILNLVKDKKED